jgi:hypothetical protein
MMALLHNKHSSHNHVNGDTPKLRSLIKRAAVATAVEHDYKRSEGQGKIESTDHVCNGECLQSYLDLHFLLLFSFCPALYVKLHHKPVRHQAPPMLPYVDCN